MSFASLIFVWVFLPSVLLLYWIFPRRHRNLILTCCSLFFYAYGAHDFVLVLMGMVTFNYLAGRAVGNPHVPDRRRDLLLVGAIVVNVGVLAYWKYGGFFDQQLVVLDHLFGGHARRTIEAVLPLGISFFTFHNISYVVDIRRGTKPPVTHFINFATYITMFPQLVAGPIVRYHEIADQLTEERMSRMGDLAAGFPRFIHGLFKKVVIADSVAPISDAAFGMHGGWTSTTAWIGAIAYTIQIYFDFSGYSDMAIGMGRMLGFRLPENFARPYSAVSITDFWHRWHMSLSRWFRDYLYIPLGGNRLGARRTYINLIIVFTLTGLWHGAAWTFVVWGLYHGAILIIERRGRDAKEHRVADWLRRTRTIVLVIFGWVLFRSSGFAPALKMMSAMVLVHSVHINPVVSATLTHERVAILLLACLVVLLPGRFVAGPILEWGTGVRVGVARLLLCTGGAAVAFVFLATETFHPFLYYQF